MPAHWSDLLQAWPVLLFWPAVALSVLAASFGLARKRPTSLLLAAALVSPASAYLAATPRFLAWGLFPICVYLAAAGAVRRDRNSSGAALVAVNAGFFAWLAFMVFN